MRLKYNHHQWVHQYLSVSFPCITWAYRYLWQRVRDIHDPVWKLFLVLSCILNFSFDCIRYKLCTHWCCIKCCEHQHEGLESQIKNPYLTEFRRIEKGIDRTYEIFIDLPKPRKMTLYNLQLNFIFSIVNEFTMLRLNAVRSKFGLLMTGF